MSKNTPEIRFNGFEDSWEFLKFIDVFNFLQNNSLSRAELDNENGNIMNVHYGDILVKYGEILETRKDEFTYLLDDALEKKYHASLLKNGDIIIADAAEDDTVGKCSEIVGITDEKILAGLHTIPCRPVIDFSKMYLGYYMNSKAYHNQLLPLIQGTKVSSISKSAIQNTSVSYPKLEKEQEKIGCYFHYLSNLITLHQQEYDKLVNNKKAMLEKMFPKEGCDVPEIRFNGFDKSWKKCKFGEIVKKYENPVPTPKDGYARLGIRSHAKGTFHSYVKKGMELETAQMHKVEAGNFIVNITFGWEHAVAITNEKDAGKLVSHRFPQYSFNEGFLPEFFKYVILDEKFRYHLWLSSPGGAGRNRVLNLNEMLEYIMIFPEEEEQRKIANVLQEMDLLIDLHEQELEKLKNIKAALLEKMFV